MFVWPVCTGQPRNGSVLLVRTQSQQTSGAVVTDTCYIDVDRSMCLCDVGMPGFVAAVLVALTAVKTSCWWINS